ncbi:SpoIIE family protein phosphatase [Methanospirillum purgamenti]|uniref:SpoIIE family protein phosphatase n=1 Tax=Methanospirillum hungatei TaxID=2203 RepID=A0A8F5VNA3_METHU|nr:SpoIIE family protein phosphatase [Methanospirillum hungatei]QXO94868.1 SpoIIE family protein phosphatase [Methanospirillum hungatei]
MDINFFESLKLLFQIIAVIFVASYLFTRSRYFKEVITGKISIKTQIILTLFFGIVSIYGTLGNIQIHGALINVRDLGPLVGGLTCGPYVGIGAGLIGGFFRYTQGGPYMYSCFFASVMAGILGAVMYYANKKQFVSTPIAIIFTILVETLHSLIALITTTPPSQVVSIITVVIIPMIIINAIGMGIFSTMYHNLIAEWKTMDEKLALETEIAKKDAELHIAAKIQQSFLPDTLPVFPGFSIAAKSCPAKEVGGDFFDIIPFQVIKLSKESLGIMIADVSGKGVPAALFMALSRIVVRVVAGWFDEPAKTITYANTIIEDNSKTGIFVTLFYGIINQEKKSLRYVNAGHNPPIIYRQTTREFFELPLTGIAIGVLPDAQYDQNVTILQSGDIICMYTDGVTEAVNETNEMYGENRLKELIQKNEYLEPQKMVDKIINDVNVFAGNEPQFDDITLMIIKVE